MQLTRWKTSVLGMVVALLALGPKLDPKHAAIWQAAATLAGALGLHLAADAPEPATGGAK